ncbi:hypothetical protein A9Q84_01825 [Halobacteriovorax marinus]|uniref:Serine protease n=1 Tax=Halobacteriovorax marinus TaxID=97084 RepID=A0A1Y5FC59_9BACT|nr:hypothetical protein A9Q84_01825 [Halobacteriovorax marinus]
MILNKKLSNTTLLLSLGIILASCGGPNSTDPKSKNIPPRAISESTQDYSLEAIDISESLSFEASCKSNTLPLGRFKAVYGVDDSTSICSDNINPQEVLRAKKTAMFVSKMDMRLAGRVDGKNIWQIVGSTLEDVLSSQYEMPVCHSVKFRKEMTPGFCTGFLFNTGDVSTNGKQLLTAGHCFGNNSSSDRSSMRVVFTVANDNRKVVSNNPYYREGIFVSEDQVFEVDYNTQEEEDFTVVTLDRKVKGVSGFEIESLEVSAGDRIQMMGHPLGLMMKFTSGKVVFPNRDESENYFGARLSSFGGNSGSPIVNLSTGKVNGILVGGQGDHEVNYRKNCVMDAVYATGSEGVLKIGKLLNL